jgi:ribosomal protein L21E
MEMFQEESEANEQAKMKHFHGEESENIEIKLAFQYKAFRGQTGEVLDALKGAYVIIFTYNH